MSRFQAASLFKNQLATPAKPEQRWSELPTSSSSHDSSNGICSAWSYALATTNSRGSLAALPFDKPGKWAQQPPSFAAASASILDIDSAFFTTLAVSSDDSKIHVFRLPSSLEEGDKIAPEYLTTLPTSTPANQVRFHPHADGLLLALTGSTVNIYDVNVSSPSYTTEATAKGLCSAAWSSDGRTIVSTGKDGSIALWDLRASSRAVTAAIGHQGIKASRVAFIAEQLFTTGFSKTRDREYALRDPRHLEKPIKVQRLDTGTGVLVPLVDNERKIVYLAGKGDMTLRWAEVGGAQTFTEGAAPLPVSITGACFAPAHTLNVMQAEINRLLISSKDGSVVPVTISIPRRTYVDFLPELFPPRRSEVPAHDATSWLQDGNELVELKPVTPASASTTAPPDATVSPAPAKAAPISSASPALPPSLPPQPTSATPPSAETPISTTSAASTPSSPAPSSTFAIPTKVASPRTPVKPSASWSRNFLSGKTPLKPDYDGLSGLATTLPADVSYLRANSRYLVLPLTGAGGRLAVHSTSNKGRLPTLLPAVVTGAVVVDFAFDSFEEGRLLVAGDDGRVRTYRLPEGDLHDDLSELEGSFAGDGMDRIHELRCHPTAQGLASTTSDDRGQPAVRVWDVDSGEVKLSVPIEGGGVYSTSWSIDGRLVALTCKDRKLRILDPRSRSILASSSSHDSARPSRCLWLDDSTHILTTGFNRSATREARIHRLDNGTLFLVASISLDVSPAPFAVHHDRDTGILFLYARGERTCRAFDISSLSSFTSLPAFEHGTLQQAWSFLPKRCVDVRAVEIASAYRLTPTSIQRVSWTIPRARSEYFQDDVFVPTRDVERPALSGEAWLRGEDAVQETIDLRPEGMPLLSEAPLTAAAVSTRNKITGPVITDSQKREQQLDRLFQMAKHDGSDSDDEPAMTAAKANAPPADDDDW